MKIFFDGDNTTIAKLRLLGKLEPNDFIQVKMRSVIDTESFKVIPMLHRRVVTTSTSVIEFESEILTKKFLDSIIDTSVNGYFLKELGNKYLIWCISDNKLTGILALSGTVVNKVSIDNGKVTAESINYDEDYEVMFPSKLLNIGGVA